MNWDKDSGRYVNDSNTMHFDEASRTWKDNESSALKSKVREPDLVSTFSEGFSAEISDIAAGLDAIGLDEATIRDIVRSRWGLILASFAAGFVVAVSLLDPGAAQRVYRAVRTPDSVSLSMAETGPLAITQVRESAGSATVPLNTTSTDTAHTETVATLETSPVAPKTSAPSLTVGVAATTSTSPVATAPTPTWVLGPQQPTWGTLLTSVAAEQE